MNFVSHPRKAVRRWSEIGKGVCILVWLLVFLISCNPVPFPSTTSPPVSSSETSSSPDTQTIRDTAHLHLIFSDTVPTEDQIAIADFYEGIVQTVTSRFHHELTQLITGTIGGGSNAAAEGSIFIQPYWSADRFLSHELLHSLLSDVLGPSPATLFHCRHNATNYYFFLNESAIITFDLYFIQPPRPIHLYAAPWVRQGVTLEQILRHGETLWPSQIIYPSVSFLLYLLETYPWDR